MLHLDSLCNQLRLVLIKVYPANGRRFSSLIAIEVRDEWGETSAVCRLIKVIWLLGGVMFVEIQ